MHGGVVIFKLVFLTHILSSVVYGGTVTLTPAAYTFTEDNVRAGGVRFTLTLVGDTWIAGQQASVISGLQGSGVDGNGWNSRRDMIATASTSGTAMVISIGPDSIFDTSVVDDVVIDIPSSAVTSNTKPVSSGGQLKVTIQPTAGTLSFELLVNNIINTGRTVTEQVLNSGSVPVAIRLTLQRGETWKVLQDNDDRLSMIEGMSGSLVLPEAWDDRKTVIIPDSSSFAVSSDAQVLTVQFSPDSIFDIASQESVTVSLPGPSYPSTLFLTNLKPSGQPWSFTITPTVSTITLMPSPLATDEGVVRRGGFSFTLRLSGWEKWVVPVNIPTLQAAMVSSTSEANGFNARKTTLIQSATTQASGRELLITMSADSIYDIANNEVVTINIPGSMLQSTLQPISSSSILTIRPLTGTWDLTLLKGGTTMTEDEVRAGGQRVILDLSGDTWSPGACTSIINSISSTMMISSSFISRRGTITPISSCSTTGSRMEISFVADMMYDIASAENLQITVPASAVSSSLVPTPASKQIVIVPSAGSLVLLPQTFTEDELVSGTATITIELTGGETWASGQQDNIVRALVSMTNSQNGFNARKNFFLDSSRIMITPQLVTIPIGTDDVFDIDEQQTVEMNLGGFLFQSSTAPPGTPSFTITPIRGRLLPVPLEFGESAIRRGGFELDLTLLNSRESWITDQVVKDTLLSSLTATLSEPFGFAQRKDILIAAKLVSFDPSKQNATIRLSPDVEYDISMNETVSLALAPGMFASGLVPDTLAPLTITIYPEAAIISLEDMPCIAENNIRDGTATISLLLSEGESWKDLPSVIAGFSSSSTSPNGFNSRRNVILPNDASTAVIDPANPQRLIISFNADNQYDVTVDDEIMITISGNAVASGIEPVPNTNPGWTSPLRFCIGPAVTNITVGSQVFTETELRQGGACLTMELGLGETWNTIDRSSWITSMNSDQSVIQTFGWRSRKDALIPSTTSISGRTNVMCFAADVIYDITRNETISVLIPSQAVSSGIAPPQPFTFIIQVVIGVVRMVLPTSFEESITRLGGARITLLLEEESWVDPPPATSITTGFMCDGVTSQGFNSRKNILLTSASYRVNAQEMRIHLSQDNSFEISETENCVINLPGDSTASGLSPTGELNFTIEPNLVYNVAGNASFTDAEIRTGSAVLDIALDNDQWAASGELILISAFTSDRSTLQEPNGFNARKSRLLPLSGLQFINDHLLRVSLQADPEFKNCRMETVIIDVPAAVVQSGRKPTVLPRGFNLTFTIIPTAKAVVDYSSSVTSTSGSIQFNETQFRTGEATFSLTITDGNWSQNAAQQILQSSTGSLNNSASWDGWKLEMFNSIISGTTLTFIAKPTPLYDIPSTEIVQLNVPDIAIGCGAIKTTTALMLTVSATPGVVTVDCSKGLLFTDWEIRQGLVHLSLIIAGDTWTDSFGELAAGMTSNSTFPTGFSGLRSRLILIPGSFSVNLNILNITMQPVSQYRIGETEEIDITIPTSMMLSGMAPGVSGCPLKFTILPGRGRVSSSPSYVTDDMIRDGGFKLIISILGDDWDSSLNKANFLSNWNVVNDSSPSGFDANRADIFQLPGALVIGSSSQTIEILFSSARSFLITSEEDLQLFITSESIVGKKPPLDSPISLQITLGNQGIRFAPTGSLFDAPGQTRTLDGSVVVPEIIIELIDSRGNRDTTLSRSSVSVSARNAAVMLNDTKAPIVNGVAIFKNLRFFTYPTDTVLIFTVDSSAGVAATNTQLESGLVTVTGSGTPIPVLPPTPGGPTGSLNTILAPIPFLDQCNTSIIIDASLTNNPAGDLFVWSTRSTSALIQIQVSSFSGPKVAVNGITLLQEVGSHDICVTVATETACQTLEIRGNSAPAVMIDSGSTIFHAASEPLVIRSYPLDDSVRCDSSSRDLNSIYSYTWTSDDGLSIPSESTSQLQLPPNTLTPGSAYGFTVTACPKNSNICKKGRVVVYSTSGLLSAGASVDALYLTANGDPPVSITVLALRNYKAVTTPFTSSWECIGCGSGSNSDLSGTGSVFQISRGDFAVGTHDLKISITHNGEQSVTWITITAASGSGPGAIIKSPDFPGIATIDSTATYSLVVYSTTGNQSNWKWNVAPTPTDTIIANTSIFTAMNVFTESTSYDLTAESSAFSFKRKLSTFPLPSGGTCVVSPDSGIANTDRHEILCSGWTVVSSSDSLPPFQSTTLEYKYKRVTGSREQDLSGGWRRSSSFTTQLGSYPNSQSAEIIVYIRPLYSKGEGVRISNLVVTFIGSPTGNSTTPATALQNGDLELAIALTFDEIFGKSGASYQQLAELVPLVNSEGQVNQLLGIYCAIVGVNAAGNTTLVSLVSSLAGLVEKLSTVGASADSRKCAISGTGKLFSLIGNNSNTGLTSPNGQLISTAHNMLSLGPKNGMQELYTSGQLTISYYSMLYKQGNSMINSPFKDQTRGSQITVSMVPLSSIDNNVLHNFGVSDWERYPSGPDTMLKVNGIDISHNIASHVVGVVVQTADGVQKSGEFEIATEMVSSSINSQNGHRAAYYSSTGEWLQDGLTLKDVSGNIGSFSSSHLTDFAVFEAPATPQPGTSSDDDDLPWWVWLFVVLSICLCCMMMIYCIYVYRTKKRKNKKDKDIDSNEPNSKTTKDMATDTTGIIEREETPSTVGNSVTKRGSDDLLIPSSSRDLSPSSRRRRGKYDFYEYDEGKNPIESAFPPQPVQPPPQQPFQPQTSVQLLNSFISPGNDEVVHSSLSSPSSPVRSILKPPSEPPVPLSLTGTAKTMSPPPSVITTVKTFPPPTVKTVAPPTVKTVAPPPVGSTKTQM